MFYATPAIYAYWKSAFIEEKIIQQKTLTMTSSYSLKEFSYRPYMSKKPLSFVERNRFDITLWGTDQLQVKFFWFQER